MSSPYPVLDNRPIDQWKVTELKEELKRRRLMTKGLKEDLIKRLDEALRNEMEDVNEDVDNGLNCEPQPEVPAMDVKKVPIGVEAAKELVDHGDNKYDKVGDDMAKVDDEVSTIMVGQGNVQPGEELGGSESSGAEEVLIVQETTVETITTVNEAVVSEIVSVVQDIPNSDTQEQNGNLNTQLENDDCEHQVEDLDSKPSHVDVMLESSIPINQVSEVSPVLGFQVKSDSISTDSMSINEMNELKDNIIADNVKLELEVVTEEIVETSFSNVVPDGGESHPMDDEEPLEKESVAEIDDNNVINSYANKENDTVDVDDSEKLNLDRSSGDDSMEEDVVENKQIDSKYNSDEVDDKSAQPEVPVVKEELPVDVVGDDMSAEIKGMYPEDKKSAAPTAKRKIHDQEAVGISEPSKRQRRWNTQSLKVPEPQNSSITFSTTPKDTFQSPGLKRNFSRSDSTKSEAAPKERVVPPSSKPPTNSLRIDRFVRPFTLKAVQELLGKTGSVTSFWMDHIKTHCYITYSSVEEAIETRNAVYNLQWPPNGGLLLVSEFVDPQEVKMRVELPLQNPAALVGTGPAAPPAPPTMQPQPSPRQQVLRQQLPPPPSLPPPPPLSNPPSVRERLTLPPPPPLPENFDPPIVTLDDLFRKTKATPRIYYLPLSEEQVAVKVATNIKQ